MKKVLIIGLGFIAITIWGCKKDFLTSLANNPNAPTTNVATPQLVLPGAILDLAQLANGVSGTTGAPAYDEQAAWMGYWNYQPGYSFVSSVQNYVMTSASPQLWDNYYGILSNLNVIAQKTAGDPNNTNYYDIANILEAICFQNLVDLYNDIPYSQALQGQGNFFPTYDDASLIYDSLTTKLDNAITDISANLSNASAVVPTTDDIMFGGDMQSWLQFANTVKLRLLIRESNVSSKQAYISSEIAKTASVGYLQTDALINPGYTDAKPNNMWYGFGVTSSGSLGSDASFIGANETAIDFFKATNDPRLGYVYTPKNVTATNPNFANVVLPLNFNNYWGNYLGIQSSNPDGTGSSNIGSGLIQGPGQGTVMMLAAESYFLQAEATVLGYIPGGAAEALPLYHAGITKSFEYLNVGGSTSAADGYAATYYNQNIGFVAFPLSASADSLEHTILEQKWAALDGVNNVEAYNDWRRTYNPAMNSGYPIVPVSASPSNTFPHMPFRYFYPTEEQNTNHDAWAAAGGATTNVFTDKIFWMN
jgi:Starch-binding associating with outer membrane